MSGEKIRLTKAIIEKTPLPLSGRQFLYDAGGVVGLCLCLTSQGTKTWYLYRKINGKPVRLKLGRFPELSVEAARLVAAGKVGKIVSGEDPRAEEREKDKKQTAGKVEGIRWSELFAKYLEQHAKVHKKTWKEDEALDRRYLVDWQELDISTISRPIVFAKHREIGANASTAANRLLSLISKVFNFAEEIGIWEKSNPCRTVKKFKEISRDRFVSELEMPRLLQAIQGYSDQTLSRFFLICLMTGARRANVLAMRWKELGKDFGTWQIPDTKSGQPVVLPLADHAQKILCEQRNLCAQDFPDSEFVFPGTGKTGHLVEPKKAWQSILKAAGLAGIKIHDLRRTLGSWQAIAGVSLPVIGKSLGHKTTSATAIYARLSLEPVRDAVDGVVRKMFDGQ
jgi:integrase